MKATVWGSRLWLVELSPEGFLSGSRAHPIINGRAMHDEERGIPKGVVLHVARGFAVQFMTRSEYIYYEFYPTRHKAEVACGKINGEVRRG